MKKLLCLLLCFIFLIAFNGCGNDDDEFFTVTSFASEVQFISNGKVTEGIFTFENVNSMYIEFSDYDLGGMKVHCENGNCRYSCDGVTVSFDVQSENEPVCGLFSAMVLLADSRVKITTGEENIFSLSDGKNEYTYTVNADGTNLMSISSIQGDIIFRYKY